VKRDGDLIKERDGDLIKEIVSPERSTLLRKNDSKELLISLNFNRLQKIFILNGGSFLSEEISNINLTIEPENCYMVINNGDKSVDIQYNKEISHHKVIYDPYKYEYSEKIILNPELFIDRFNIPKNYIDTLPKWYSFKFTFPDYNLIFIRPEFGISIQIHQYRDEFWEILEGNPIIINGDKVHYFVKNGTKFTNQINTYHSAINPNANKFVIIKERWEGNFDENDIQRIFNPNQYH
jgi:mannose-6-phosphate isomerase-like protein (cupin superfamily)